MRQTRKVRQWMPFVIVGMIGVILGAALPSTAVAQIPDEFTNLKVLPPDIAKKDLLNTMKGFAMGLGVRCWYCHKGEGDDFSTFDFASDEKEKKEIARTMLRMVMSINRDFIAKLPAGEGERQRVRCITCHRGKDEPEIEMP